MQKVNYNTLKENGVKYLNKNMHFELHQNKTNRSEINTYNQNSIKIDGVSITIDHWDSEADIIYISHAHMDHIPYIPSKDLESLNNSAKNSPRFVCSKITKAIAELRTYNKFSFPEHLWILGENLRQKPTVSYKGLDLTLLENGHTYGSCSLYIQGSESALYTSDFVVENKFINSSCTPLNGLESKPCNNLIMECTYGIPDYRFPKLEEVQYQLNQIIDTNLRSGIPIIILAYAFGKSQVMLNLLKKPNKILLERKIAKVVKTLEEFGQKFNSWEPYGNYNKNLLSKQKDYVLIIPPYDVFQEPYTSLVKNGAKVIYVSGKVLNAKERKKFPADYYLTYSDHCDFMELTGFVKDCNPEMVYLHHGQIPEFFYHLYKSGTIPAESIFRF